MMENSVIFNETIQTNYGQKTSTKENETDSKRKKVTPQFLPKKRTIPYNYVSRKRFRKAEEVQPILSKIQRKSYLPLDATSFLDLHY